MKKLLKLTEYAKLVGISIRTAWRRVEEGKLTIVRTDTNRAFVELPMEDEDIIHKKDYTVIYCRVSSSENKANLDIQAERLVNYCNAKGWKVHEIVKEISSGLNDERPKLIKLFNSQNITKVVVEHKDRLTRFGFNYLKQLWKVKIIVVNEMDTAEKDLMQDFISLVTSFTTRLYGKRQSKRKTEEIIKNLKQENETS